MARTLNLQITIIVKKCLSCYQGDGRSLKGGLYSPQVLTEDLDSFARLLGLTKDDIVKERKKQEQIDPHHFY